MTISSDDVKKIERFIEIRNKGYYCDAGVLNDVYNRVLSKNATPTTCGSCMRGRITELEQALNRFKSEQELEKPLKKDKKGKK